jgi:hypothetical protein
MTKRYNASKFHVGTFFKTNVTVRNMTSKSLFENRVLRKTFGPMRDELTGYWRKLHNEELMLCIPHKILCM